MKALPTFFTSIILSLAPPTQALAQTYLSGHAGYGVLQDAELRDATGLPGSIDLDFGGNVSFSGAVGFLLDVFRTELELSYQEHDIDSFGIGGARVEAGTAGLDGNASSLSGLINAYFDVDLGTGLAPYFTAGIGMTRVGLELSVEDDDLGTVTEDDSDATLAYQLGAGLGFALMDNLVLDLRYRYFIGDEPTFGDTRLDYKSHSLMGGLRFIF